MKKNIYKISFLIIGIFVAIGTSYLNAWTGPTQTPPAGNVDAPVNLSTLSQVKLGGLSVASLLATGGVGASQYCDVNGQNCFGASDVSGSEIVLDVNNGSGVSTTPGGVTVDFNQETVDSQNSFNLGTDTFSAQTGTYSFEIGGYGCGFASDNGTGSDQFYVQLRKNGVPVLVSPVLVSQAGYNCLQPQISGVVQANSGDTFTMYAWHDEVATNVSSTMKATKMSGSSSGSSVPAGAVMPFNSSTCPSGWIASDGTNGTVDLRGYFVRGLNTGSTGNDPNRTLGSTQEDEFESHTHYVSPMRAYGTIYGGGSNRSAYAPDGQSLTSSATGGTETRPKNVALLYCQKI